MSWTEWGLYQLTVEGVLLHVPGCWTVTNAEVLRRPGPNKVSNAVVLGRNGTAPRPVFPDEAVHRIEMYFAGEKNRHGDPFDDPAEGLASNLAEFSTLVVKAGGANGDGILSVRFDAPNGTSTGVMQVRDFVDGDGVWDCTAVMTVVLAGGQTQPSGS